MRNPDVSSHDPYAVFAQDMMGSLLDTAQGLALPFGPVHWREIRRSRDYWMEIAPDVVAHSEPGGIEGVTLMPNEQQVMPWLDPGALAFQVRIRVHAGRVARHVLSETLGVTPDGFVHTGCLREPGTIHTVPLSVTVDGWSDSYAGRLRIALSEGLTPEVIEELRAQTGATGNIGEVE